MHPPPKNPPPPHPPILLNQMNSPIEVYLKCESEFYMQNMMKICSNHGITRRPDCQMVNTRKLILSRWGGGDGVGGKKSFFFI